LKEINKNQPQSNQMSESGGDSNLRLINLSLSASDMEQSVRAQTSSRREMETES